MPKKIKYGNILQFASEDTQKATFKGTIYRKQIAKFGQWVNPDYPWFSDDPNMTLDEAWGETIVKNFNDDALGSPVPVPLNHTDDVRVNTGLVESLEVVAGDGLYANLKIADDDTIDKLDKGLIFDVSISFMWDFIRQDNGKHYGATLLHVALVNTPYLIGMTAFEKVGEALSKLSKSFKPVGLSLASEGAIMLSRTKVKELSNVEESTIKNDKEFDVTVTYKDGEEDVEVVVKAGEEVTVPTEVAEEVTTQISEAVAPSEDEDDSNSEDENKDDDANSDDDSSENSDDDKKEEEDEDEEADKDKALAKAQLKNAEYAIKERYNTLLSAGKVIPAQETKILALAKLGAGVQLSTESGKKIDLATVVLDILEAGNVKFSTEENGSDKEDENQDDDSSQNSDENKKPSETLSEAELAGFKAVGADPAKMDELAEKDPVFREALKTLSSKYQKKGTK
jgi:hypothetical protein